MTLVRNVTLPAATAVGGGILAQARPLPDGWELGTEFATEVCLIAGTHQFCPDEVNEKTFQGTDIARFEPFGVEVSVACTTLTPFDERLDKARAALVVVAEFNVGQQLASATAVPTNPDLGDAVSGGSAATAAEALALLEGVIANSLHGHLAWVHVSPARLTELAVSQAIHMDEMGAWRTATGHLVVSSPGYVALLADEIVATPEVFAAVGDVELIRTTDRADNRHMAVHEAAALAVFDPCFNVTVSITDSP